MLLKLDGKGPLYQQIYQTLRRMILDGKLPAGSRLPSTRVLRHELRVSRNTALLAYGQLLGEGYVVGRGGSGTYVAAELPDVDVVSGPPRSRSRAGDLPPQLSAAGCRLMDLPPLLPLSAWPEHTVRPRLRYDFRYGAPAIASFPNRTWWRLLIRRSRLSSSESLGYGAPEGYLPLRESIADYLQRNRGVHCDADQVVIVNGSQQALDLTARLLLDPGDQILMEEPHYHGARCVFSALGARIVPVSVDAEGLDLERVPRARQAARLAYVTPSHQFPTGVVMSLPRRLALLRWAAEHAAYVLEDDYDSEYRYERRPLEAIQGLDSTGRVIYMGTCSQVLFPSLRLGYLVLPRNLVRPFTAAKSIADRHTGTLQQEVLADFFREGHFERHLRRSRARLGQHRGALLQALAQHLGDTIEVSGASAGIHLLIWLRTLSPGATAALIGRAAGEGVGLSPISSCYLTAAPRAGLMLGYAGLSETEIRDGIEILARVIRSLPRESR